MPIHLRELALSVARCPEVGRVDEVQPDGLLHPCHKVVHAQDNHAGPFQVPEAWAGNLESAKVVFVSSNPAISEGRPEAKLPSKRIAEMYPTVEWSDDDTADFMVHRFSSEKKWVVDRRHLKVDGVTRGSKEPYWGWIEKQIQALLGQQSIWHEDAVMTEVVHCKSNKEHGVAEAALHCSSLHLGRILSATSAGLIVVVGDKARRAFQIAYADALGDYPRFGADEANGRPDPAQNIVRMSIGGTERLVCFLWHPGSGSFLGKITQLPDLYPEDFGRLQDAATGDPDGRKPTPPASRIRRQQAIEEILGAAPRPSHLLLQTELLKVFPVETARTWLDSFDPELNGHPADVFLMNGPEPVIAALASLHSENR